MKIVNNTSTDLVIEYLVLNPGINFIAQEQLDLIMQTNPNLLKKWNKWIKEKKIIIDEE